jgi:3-methyladenine DNA glycosylase AlkD
MYKVVIKELKQYSNSTKASIYKRFFKTGKGEYGQGDIFLGLTVPEIQYVSKKYIDISFKDIKYLLYSKYHEIRVCGFTILTYKYTKYENKKEVVDFYIKHLKQANNWDLVDLSCYKVLGSYLIDNTDEIDILYKLAKSDNLW